MKKSTSKISAMLRSGALAAVLGIAFGASAQTFIHEGVVYKASGNKLTAQKATVKPENGDAPGNYSGDIVVPYNVQYNGKDYVVTSVAAVFKGEPITSIEIAPGVTTFSRGVFQDCVELTRVVLPSDLTTLAQDMFNGCVKLEELSIPGTVTKMTNTQIKDCKGLKKLIFEEGKDAIEISNGMFGVYDKDKNSGGMEVMTSLKELVINRPIADNDAMASKTFRGNTYIENVTLGGSLTSLPTSVFENMTALKSVKFESAVSSLGTNVFAGSGIETVTFPASLTTIPSSTFQGCKSLKSVKLEGDVTSIQDMAFYNSTLSEIALPASVKSIGQMAFSGTNLQGALVLPAELTSLGLQAFAGNSGVTSVSFPANLTVIGDGAFTGCTGIAKYEVAAGNEVLSTVENGCILTSNGGKNIVAVAPASTLTAIQGDYTSISANAANGAKGVKTVNLPSCESWGDFAVSGTSIESLTVQGSVGRYVAANCPALKEITVVGKEVPYGITSGCTALTTVNLEEKIATVKQDAFKGCTALESLNLGSILSIIEADAFASCGLKTLTVTAANPAAMAKGVFKEGMTIKVVVPVDLVDTYKAAEGWKNLEIVGDANLASGPADMGMPNALYYAGTDGMLHAVYSDGETDTYDVGGVPHTFQLAQFKNRIYGACAGQKFYYSATGAVDGDGKLFYISKVGGELFQAVVLDNTDGNAYQDPFGIYVYGDTLYVNDRNVCIRKIPADAIALPKNFESWVENNWLGFYGSPWTYGCIKAGWAITQDEDAKEPVYWVGMKYNGNGIYRFKEENVGTAALPGPKPENGVFLNGITPLLTTFHIDEENGHMYIYLEKAGSEAKGNYIKGGLYRINLDDLESNPDPSDFNALNPILVDGAPVYWEGSGENEHVGISQLTPDENNEYLYWCYRAASASDVDAVANGTANHYPWAEEFDENNPLHKSGIKRIKLGQAQPEVELIVPGVEGYGVVPVNFEGSKKDQDGVKEVTVINDNSAIEYTDGVLTVTEDATVHVYNMSGLIVASATLKAGETLSVENLEAGVYVATAGNSVVKFVK